MAPSRGCRALAGGPLPLLAATYVPQELQVIAHYQGMPMAIEQRGRAGAGLPVPPGIHHDPAKGPACSPRPSPMSPVQKATCGREETMHQHLNTPIRGQSSPATPPATPSARWFVVKWIPIVLASLLTALKIKGDPGGDRRRRRSALGRSPRLPAPGLCLLRHRRHRRGRPQHHQRLHHLGPGGCRLRPRKWPGTANRSVSEQVGVERSAR